MVGFQGYHYLHKIFWFRSDKLFCCKCQSIRSLCHRQIISKQILEVED